MTLIRHLLTASLIEFLAAFLLPCTQARVKDLSDIAVTDTLSNHSADSHLRFKGIEIDGTMDGFLTKLKDKGYADKGNGFIEGTFAGYPAIISTKGTQKTNTVYLVTARLPLRKSWSDVENDYETFRRNLMFKYDNPANEENAFRVPYRKGDGYEKKAFDNNLAIWRCDWRTPEGTIDIEITSEDNGFRLVVTYIDAWGMDKQSKETISSFMEDL